MRIRNEAHLNFIRQLDCLVCGDNTSTEAAHIRYADSRIGKPITGNSIKPHDFYVVPLCGRHHREQHRVSEWAWWNGRDVDPILIALALFSVSGDHAAGSKIIQAALRFQR